LHIMTVVRHCVCILRHDPGGNKKDWEAVVYLEGQQIAADVSRGPRF